jgi:DNA-binding transcriptional LysR family regulator
MGKPYLSDRQLTAFKHVMECGSVSAAAQRMFIAQPGVTRLLKQLELELGFALFDRVKGRLIATPEARLFYREQCRVWQGVEHLRATARRILSRDIGHLRLCAMPLLGMQFLPDVVTRYLGQFPETRVDLFVERSEQVVEDVITQRVDLGIALLGNEDERVRAQAFALPTVCLMSNNHPLARQPSVALTDLQGLPMIDFESSDRTRTQLELLLDQAGVQPKRVMQVSFALQAARCVQNGLGIALIDALTAHSLRDGNLTVRPLSIALDDEVYLLTARDQPTSMIAQDFLPYLLSSLNQDVHSVASEHQKSP